MKETITLNNGVEMPRIGFGVFQVSNEEAEKAVLEAIRIGYRSVDTAQAYQNEEGVGNAWVKSGVDREDLFLTTKVWISNSGLEKASLSIDGSLRKLRTEYIDLLLIHQDYGDVYGTYRAMEKALEDGKVRAIGVSNFYYDRFLDIADQMSVKPAVNQIEGNVFSQQKEMRELMAKYGTHMMAWGPLAEGKFGLFTNPVLTEIGKKYSKTAAQVALRYLLQLDIIIIPKSVKPERMEQNFDLLNFSLDDGEMKEIAALDKGHGAIVDFDDYKQRLAIYPHLMSYRV